MSLLKSNPFWSGVRFASIASMTGALSLIDKNRARTYLAEQLGAIPGIPAKFSQYLSLEHTNPTPLALSEIKARIELLSPKLVKEIIEIDERGITASIGQVHRVRLRDGRDLAVKVQYPGIKENLEAQITLLTSLMGKSPAARYGLDTAAYSHFLREHFKTELDYQNEAKNQERFSLGLAPLGNTVVAKILWEFTTPEILVQTWEPSIGLEEIRKLRDVQKNKFLDIWSEWFLSSLLKTGLIHADLQPGNWGYRPESGELILYDFGAVLELDARALSGIRKLAKEDPSTYDCLGCLADIGFETAPLKKIETELPQLCALLRKSLGQGGMKDDLEALLGEKKWYFRAAGKPHLILLMRALDGFFKVFKELGVQSTESPYSAPVHLKVRVVEAGCEVVAIEMPARSVEDLENLLAPETREKIEGLGHNLTKIKQRAIDSGCTAQVLFEASLGARHYRVWLE